MSRPTDTDTPLSLDVIDEDRVRRALGLKSSGGPPHQQRPEQARQRHRFVTDGSVPVVMLNRTDSETSGLKDRLSAAEHALENERNAHAATRRTLQELQQSHQTLQTRLSHSELSHNDVVRAERDGRLVAEQKLTALHDELAQLKASPPAPVKIRRDIKAISPIVRQKRLSTEEPKPVRWWTPSYRSKQS